jgi:hypothetical protein
MDTLKLREAALRLATQVWGWELDEEGHHVVVRGTPRLRRHYAFTLPDGRAASLVFQLDPLAPTWTADRAGQLQSRLLSNGGVLADGLPRPRALVVIVAPKVSPALATRCAARAAGPDGERATEVRVLPARALLAPPAAVDGLRVVTRAQATAYLNWEGLPWRPTAEDAPWRIEPEHLWRVRADDIAVFATLAKLGDVIAYPAGYGGLAGLESLRLVVPCDKD